MTRVTLVALALIALPTVGRAEDTSDPFARFHGSWVCIEQAGKKPAREVKLVVDKTGGYKMGGTGRIVPTWPSWAGPRGSSRSTRTGARSTSSAAS